MDSAKLAPQLFLKTAVLDYNLLEKHPQTEPGSIYDEHEYFRTHLQNAIMPSFYICIKL